MNEEQEVMRMEAHASSRLWSGGNPIDDLTEKAVREAIARGGSDDGGFGEDEDGFVDGVDNPMNDEQ